MCIHLGLSWHPIAPVVAKLFLAVSMLTRLVMLGVEVCSKPPQPHKATASSSGNMVATLQQIEEAEQAGSVEQPAPAVEQLAPAVAKIGRLPKQGVTRQSAVYSMPSPCTRPVVLLGFSMLCFCPACAP